MIHSLCDLLFDGYTVLLQQLYIRMYVIVDKPTLSFKKPSTQLPGKSITIYTNQLQKVSRSGLIQHLIQNNKLSTFSHLLSVSNMSKREKEVFALEIYMRTMQGKENYIVDLILERDQDLLQYKVEYPLVLQFKIVKYEETINSLTKALTVDKFFTVLGKLGEGSYAQIFLAREQGTQHLRAIKAIDKAKCNKLGDVSFIYNEIAVLRQVPSPWIIDLYYVFQDAKNVYLVTEYCPYGDLHTEINRKYRQISLFTKYIYFIQIAFSICRLHQKGFLYRDLKPENVVIDYNGNAKLCDFGFAAKYSKNQLYYEICGSYEYIPPQMVTKQGYNHSFDLYCLGLLFYQMLTGFNPFKGITPKNLDEIKEKKINFDIEGVDYNAKDLVRRLMEKDPKKRIGFQDSSHIFRHAFFKENSEIVMKVLKNQKIKQRQLTQKPAFYPLTKNKNTDFFTDFTQKPIHILGTKIYNYLTPQFNITQKMGPKMVPSEIKSHWAEQQ